MSGGRSWALGCAGAFALMGCGPAGVVEAGACGGLRPGDLVITEIHANPDGSDGDGEYFELFNTTGSPLRLDGLTLATSRSDGASPKSHRVLGGQVEGGAYIVLGNSGAEPLPGHIHYSYGTALGSLRNSDGVLLVRCGELLVDQVFYEQTVDGRALELDGRASPDHETNDDANHWCATPAGVAEFAEGNFGTPGESNSPCEIETLPEGGCLDAGSKREVRAPAPGDVRITEWMANPRGADAELEWIEVSFAADLDLNGFELGAAPDSLRVVVDQDDCFPVGAGSWVVFGASPAAAPRVDAELGLSLGNFDARSIVAGFGEVVLDRVDYDGTVEGSAWQLDDDGEACLASADEYAPGNFGTPGEPNPACPPVLSPGMCFDEGAPREIVSPAPGEARITEWMANPTASDNRHGEWVELGFRTAVDLNGLSLSDLAGSETTVQSDTCLRVEPGEHVVFVRDLDPAQNGGIADARSQLSISLNNQDETITLSVDGEVLDSVSYRRSESGVATQVDDAGNTCSADRPYGDGDLGTPGAANPWCF